MDQRKGYDTVDEFSLERHFVYQTRLPFLCKKSGVIHSASGFYSMQTDRQSDEILINLKNYKILY